MPDIQSPVKSLMVLTFQHCQICLFDCRCNIPPNDHVRNREYVFHLLAPLLFLLLILIQIIQHENINWRDPREIVELLHVVLLIVYMLLIHNTG